MWYIKRNKAWNELAGWINKGIRHVTICYVHIGIWSTGKVLENANIFFIYIAHTNTYLVVCM